MSSQAPVPFLQVDSFTREPFAGNPAAVCLLEAEPPAAWMQHVAAEMNLSETAFTWPSGESIGLRWFTPLAEVDLCGHATLATAHVLWETERLAKGETATFETRSGRLTANQAGDAIQLDFPAEPAEACPAGDLADALGSEIVWHGKNRMDFIAQLPNAEAVRCCAPDLQRLSKLQTRGVIITAKADSGKADFVSRFFCPGLGIDEDPVTGSAHCCLAPFWSERLGKKSLTGYQASKRGGTVGCELAGDRVLLNGHAVTVFSGQVHAVPSGA
jgi:PhzF family phenazine biosynthesis protein